ncbi:MAG: family 78 glycoside hydrolase catalytic domain [Bacteroidota bacterium]|nr:family 78 glycoside hydrolase catalytic domain [Bacteroidota bacterium]
MKKKLLFLIFLVVGLSPFAYSAKVEIKNLEVEMKKNPAGIEVSQPRFSWQITSTKPNLVQTAYRIQVADSPEKLAKGKDLLWDSKMVSSDKSILISYEGKKLISRQQCFWRVCVKTNQGKSKWSEVSTWSMALLDAYGWKASWIGENAISNKGEGDTSNTRLAARYLRKEFSAARPVKRAVLYISGLGLYEAFINGKPVSNDVLAPSPSLFTDRVYYNVYDVTSLLQDNVNTLGIVLGNGRYFSMRGRTNNKSGSMLFFGLPRLLAQLEIEYTDGTTSTLASDASWKVTSKGPVISNNEYDGEEYDARLELGDWNQNGFDDSQWKSADIMDNPRGSLTAQQNPNITVQDEVHPVSISKRADGKYIVDMGQNMVGWLNIRLKGKKGQPVVMTFAEALNDDKTLYLKNLRTAQVTDIYTPARDGEFSWEPHFTYHGFRFVEISGMDEEPELTSFTGKVIYDKMETTGHFETSDALVNKIFTNAYWGVRSNYRGMPTDCPQRDERMGWLGDRATGCYGEAFIFNNALLYSKWLQDIEDSQSPEGSISNVSPKYWTIYGDDVTWPSAFFNAADMLYHQYGDDSGIRKHYAAMKLWIEHMQKKSMQNYVMTKDSYGDWCMPPETKYLIHSKDPSRKTDGKILNTAVYYDLLNKMSGFAKLCGKDQDTVEYKDLAAKMKDAYNTKFFNSATSQYGNNTVTANILSLCLGLVPNGYEGKVFENIVNKTEKDFDGHVSVGVLGIQHLMRGLTEHGNVDLAWKIVTNDTYPSWGYMVKNGATTIWELWNGNTADPAMNSGNHVMLLGDLNIWFFENLAGIKCAPGTQGYKQLIMCPAFPQGLDSVHATYKSVYGEIKSDWNKKGSNFVWDVTIPGNTSALVCIPKSFNIVKNKQAGIRKITESGAYTEIEVGSGNYHFASK